MRIATASQTVGPFFNFGLTANPSLGKMAGDGAQGERIRLSLRVVDGDGIPAPGDAMLELWQADANGKYNHPEDTRPVTADAAFCGFGRLETDGNGTCVFETVKPGGVPQPDGTLTAPHINVSIFARGLLKHLVTRVYFSGDPANDTDAVLQLVPEERRSTLLAQQENGLWHLEIRLQGADETVFFEL
ncbi:MAG: protocatechuate 3,4-dioxygenase subunit alpha [Candidatus Solibacter usitatus]|nr:protocatechuate 3,4-dioxygenase subunit alpha [Candidatus Solibacter usitatus]